MNKAFRIKRIEEFSDTELMNELANRFDDIVLAARKLGFKGKRTACRRRFWKGDYDACVGLVMGAAQDCLNKNWGISEGDIDGGDV